MSNDANPAAALRAAMRDLLNMFTETLGEDAGAAALKTAVERALADVAGLHAKRAGRASARTRKPTAKARATPAPQSAAPAKKSAAKKRKKKAKAGPPSPGRLRQMEAMKEYWRKKRAEADAKEKAGGQPRRSDAHEKGA